MADTNGSRKPIPSVQNGKVYSLQGVCYTLEEAQAMAMSDLQIKELP